MDGNQKTKWLGGVGGGDAFAFAFAFAFSFFLLPTRQRARLAPTPIRLDAQVESTFLIDPRPLIRCSSDYHAEVKSACSK